MPRVVGLDLGAPRAIAVLLDGGARETLLDGTHGPFAQWDGLSPRDAAALATGSLSAVRARLPDGDPPRAVVVLPSHLDAERRDALLAAVASAGFEVAQTVSCAEAVAAAAGAVRHDGVTAALSMGLGHIEVGLFESYGGATLTRASRGVRVANGDALAESLTSWLALSYGRRHPGARLDAPDVVGKVVAAVARAVGQSQPDAATTVALPFLAQGGAATELRVEPDVLALALDELVERVASMLLEALAGASIAPSRVTRLAASGRQLRCETVARRIAQRHGWPCQMLDPAAAALGGALSDAESDGASQRPTSPGRPSIQPAPAALSRPPAPVFPSAIAASSPPAASRSVAPSVAPAATSMAPAATSVTPPTSPSLPPTSPSEAPGGSLRRQGVFTAVRDAAGLLAEPIAHAATAVQISRTMSLPGLLAQIGMRPAFEGTLVLQHEREAVRIGLIRGSPLTSPAERPRMLRAFEWPGGTYELVPELPPGRSGLIHEPMAGFLVAGLRPMLRDLTEDSVLKALGPRAAQAPVLRPGREAKLERMGLGAAESRAATHVLVPSLALSSLILVGGMTRGATLRLVFLLELFDLLQWAPPVAQATGSPHADLARRVARMSVQNHFEVLGIHWSVNAHEVADAWNAFALEYGVGGAWHRVDAALARQALERAEAARRALSDDAGRLRHRREAYPAMDPDMVAPLVAGRAQHLAMSRQGEEADDMLRLLRELGSAPPPPKR